jgi:hypothetical protein
VNSTVAVVDSVLSFIDKHSPPPFAAARCKCLVLKKGKLRSKIHTPFPMKKVNMTNKYDDAIRVVLEKSYNATQLF